MQPVVGSNDPKVNWRRRVARLLGPMMKDTERSSSVTSAHRSTPGQRRRAVGLSPNRVEAFSDGVFAIALTLLIFNIKVPEVHTEAALLRALSAQWLAYFSYALSVVVVGVFWVGHHALFHYIRRVDRPLLWLNIVFVGTVAFIPFPAALLGQYGQYRSAVALYGGTLAVAGIVLDGMRAYAYNGRRLVDATLSDDVSRGYRRRARKGPTAYLLAVGIAFLPIGAIASRISLVIFVLVPLLYILPGRPDIHWTRSHDEHDRGDEAP
jgi:uncharacterized membrane protein